MFITHVNRVGIWLHKYMDESLDLQFPHILLRKFSKYFLRFYAYCLAS